MRKIRIPMSVLEESHNPKRVEEDRSIAIEVSANELLSVRVLCVCVWGASHVQLLWRGRSRVRRLSRVLKAVSFVTIHHLKLLPAFFSSLPFLFTLNLLTPRPRSCAS